MELIIFDDAVANEWAPFALTRPCGELRFGRWTLRERIERITGRTAAGHQTRSWLKDYSEMGTPRVVSPARVKAGTLLWSARAVPALNTTVEKDPANIWIDDRLAGVQFNQERRYPDANWLAQPTPFAELPNITVEGEWLEAPWDLVARGSTRLGLDLSVAHDPYEESEVPHGCWKLGKQPLVLGEDVDVEPGVLFDTREGPIELAAHVEVRAGARLAGPLYAGEHSRLLGGSISAFSGGPYCYMRGEIEHVTVMGYSNKVHQGFLGHAVVGTWVNLGAMTTNSDLKNNYGTIRVGVPEMPVDTGLTKLGCLIGDHVKTGIGSLLNAGTVVGAGSNLFGHSAAPKWIEPFSWGHGLDHTTYRRDDFVSLAIKVAARRNVMVDEQFKNWLGAIWDQARGEA
jgi:UDP-N-acetylglucosamine diphosphorylase/glucosamine-1-phosphate N-acetyltransferase